VRTKNIAWNIFGLSIPLIAAALTVPRLIEQIGMEKFGLLTVAWGLIGFAGVFDLGLGRAATQIISQLLSDGQPQQVPSVVKTAANLSLRIGCAGGLLLSAAVLLGVHENIKFSEAILGEVKTAAYILTLTIPIQATSAMYRGVNEAFQAFKEINIIRIGLGLANFAAPWLMTALTDHLAALVGTLFVSRLIALFYFRKYAFSKSSMLSSADATPSEQTSSDIAKRLLSFGGWVTVSNIVTPVLMQSDRLLVGSLISASAVAIYVIPYELVVQSLIVCGAVTTTLFPVFAGMAKSQPNLLHGTFFKWLAVVSALMFAVTAGFFLIAGPVLSLWLGASFNEESVDVAHILSLGLVPYAIGSMYLALLHAHARPDVTAKAHLVEVPLFLMGLYWAISTYGVNGAAGAWVARVTLDAVILVVWYHGCGRQKLIAKTAAAQ
jgi:O-antigen/teichoic acid export membrane protein